MKVARLLEILGELPGHLDVKLEPGSSIGGRKPMITGVTYPDDNTILLHTSKTRKGH